MGKIKKAISLPAQLYPETEIVDKRLAGDDLFASIKTPLIVGSLLGLIPIRGLLKKYAGLQTFTWLHWRTGIQILIIFLIFCNVIFTGNSFLKELTDPRRNSAGNLVGVFSGVWFYCAGTVVYLFFLFQSKALCNYFMTWQRISNTISDTLAPDLKIRRDMNLICAVVLLDCLGENILFHFHSMKADKIARLGELSLNEVLEDYYNGNEYIFPFFSYNPVVTLAFLVTNKLTTYAWNFGDVILMLIARALYSRYASLNHYLEGLMVQDKCIPMISKGSVCWCKVRRNFLLINKLLEETNRIFAPLIWLSYTTDIFFVCNQLYMTLVPTPRNQAKLVNTIYIWWSLFHLILRTLAVNVMAAKVNENAHKIFKILQHCYEDEYSSDVSRLECFLRSQIVGISGNGCFVITRTFVLMVISAIFTLEVVLLQNSSLTVG